MLNIPEHPHFLLCKTDTKLIKHKITFQLRCFITFVTFSTNVQSNDRSVCLILHNTNKPQQFDYFFFSLVQYKGGHGPNTLQQINVHMFKHFSLWFTDQCKGRITVKWYTHPTSLPFHQLFLSSYNHTFSSEMLVTTTKTWYNIYHHSPNERRLLQDAHCFQMGNKRKFQESVLLLKTWAFYVLF